MRLPATLVVIMMLILLAACGGGSEQAKTPDGRPAVSGTGPVFEAPPEPGRKP